MRHYNDEINLFVDCELEMEKRDELFSHLSECKECQNLLVDLLALKEKSRIFCSDNISDLKNKPKTINKFYRLGFYTTSAAAIILLFLFITSKPKETYITKNEVSVDTVFVQKEVPAAQLTNSNSNSFNPGKKGIGEKSSQQYYVDYVMSLRTVKITEADVVKKRNGS